MPMGLLLTSLDVDRDTRVSRAEVREGVAEGFVASDTNGDGFLSPLEFQDWSRTYLGSDFPIPGRLHFDRDQDGRISMGEFTITFEGIQQRLDVNEDGALVRAELLTEISGLGMDPEAVRAQIEAEMRQTVEARVREICQRGARSR